MRRRVDVRPAGPISWPETGLGRGWEPAAIMTASLLLLSMGLVTVYSASAFLAQRQNLPDYFYALRQATGAALGLVVLVGPWLVWLTNITAAGIGLAVIAFDFVAAVGFIAFTTATSGRKQP